MTKILLIGIVTITCVCCGDDESQPINTTDNLTLVGNVQFATLDDAREMLTMEDEFTESLSLFDIHARLQDENGTKEELIDHISSQAMEWKIEEQEKINRVVRNIHNSIIDQGLKLEFDYKIHFVKTSGDEEGGAAAYTRQNFIVLNDNVLSSPDDNLARLISHELFHIISRNDDNLSNEMYNIIGFEKGNAVTIPDQLKDLKMTNPDAPLWNSFITLTNNDDEVSEYVMINYSNEPYDGGNLFGYLNVGFLKVKGTGVREVEYITGAPVIGLYGDFIDFYEQVGNNTNYTIHPEEILADNFALAIMEVSSLPSPWVVEEIRSKLQ